MRDEIKSEYYSASASVFSKISAIRKKPSIVIKSKKFKSMKKSQSKNHYQKKYSIFSQILSIPRKFTRKINLNLTTFLAQRFLSQKQIEQNPVPLSPSPSNPQPLRHQKKLNTYAIGKSYNPSRKSFKDVRHHFSLPPNPP